MSTEPKEGVDFEWVEVKNSGGTAKTRRFFTAKEKKARAEPVAKTVEAPQKAKASVRPKPRPQTKKDEPKKAEAIRLTFGDRKSDKEVPRSMGKENEDSKVKTGDVGVGAIATGGALTAAAIAARRKARTSTTPKMPEGSQRQLPAPKGKLRLSAPEARLALPKPANATVATPPPAKKLALPPPPAEAPKTKPKARPKAKPKPTVTAPTEATKGKARSSRGGGAAGGKLRGLGGGLRGLPGNKFDPLNLGFNKGGVVKKKC